MPEAFQIWGHSIYRPIPVAMYISCPSPYSGLGYMIETLHGSTTRDQALSQTRLLKPECGTAEHTRIEAHGRPGFSCQYQCLMFLILARKKDSSNMPPNHVDTQEGLCMLLKVWKTTIVQHMSSEKKDTQ